jgi:hypothetical protein
MDYKDLREFEVVVSGVAYVTQSIYVMADNEADAEAIVVAGEKWNNGVWKYSGLVEPGGRCCTEVRCELVSRNK